ncbi:hypothetical protein GUITHDRAFT_136220 [Guillardia theta CCMP2712]|uniref:WW domain-containing protein n=1 Tax=Guillardia theta (strain CCMP2712) TaxID=905079 RepID=L1JLN1_GUITC|nr:hypothetical protein GUITHDRAFT_136220 [Guillardia theta CCMP2712]EKX49035.1 hypothetical protein GUITHDRAFT_136220 [Guillardia theta CCMP2712]|eukprot:XP_005836015.1 hypothetical protein GUITHDRAFT_136220 [Guillardia theta CCMP2712]
MASSRGVVNIRWPNSQDVHHDLYLILVDGNGLDSILQFERNERTRQLEIKMEMNAPGAYEVKFMADGDFVTCAALPRMEGSLSNIIILDEFHQVQYLHDDQKDISQVNVEDMFEVKQQDTFPVKDEDTFPVKDEDTFPVKDEDTFPVKDEDTFPVKDEDTSPVKDTFPVKDEHISQVKEEQIHHGPEVSLLIPYVTSQSDADREKETKREKETNERIQEEGQVVPVAGEVSPTAIEQPEVHGPSLSCIEETLHPRLVDVRSPFKSSLSFIKDRTPKSVRISEEAVVHEIRPLSGRDGKRAPLTAKVDVEAGRTRGSEGLPVRAAAREKWQQTPGRGFLFGAREGKSGEMKSMLQRKGIAGGSPPSPRPQNQTCMSEDESMLRVESATMEQRLGQNQRSSSLQQASPPQLPSTSAPRHKVSPQQHKSDPPPPAVAEVVSSFLGPKFNDYKRTRPMIDAKKRLHGGKEGTDPPAGSQEAVKDLDRSITTVEEILGEMEEQETSDVTWQSHRRRPELEGEKTFEQFVEEKRRGRGGRDAILRSPDVSSPPLLDPTHRSGFFSSPASQSTPVNRLEFSSPLPPPPTLPDSPIRRPELPSPPLKSRPSLAADPPTPPPPTPQKSPIVLSETPSSPPQIVSQAVDAQQLSDTRERGSFREQPGGSPDRSRSARAMSDMSDETRTTASSGQQGSKAATKQPPSFERGRRFLQQYQDSSRDQKKDQHDGSQEDEDTGQVRSNDDDDDDEQEGGEEEEARKIGSLSPDSSIVSFTYTAGSTDMPHDWSSPDTFQSSERSEERSLELDSSHDSNTMELDETPQGSSGSACQKKPEEEDTAVDAERGEDVEGSRVSPARLKESLMEFYNKHSPKKIWKVEGIVSTFCQRQGGLKEVQKIDKSLRTTYGVGLDISSIASSTKTSDDASSQGTTSGSFQVLKMKVHAPTSMEASVGDQPSSDMAERTGGEEVEGAMEQTAEGRRSAPLNHSKSSHGEEGETERRRRGGREDAGEEISQRLQGAEETSRSQKPIPDGSAHVESSGDLLGTSSVHKEEDEVLPEGWKKKLSKQKGVFYYYNQQTQQTTWTRPET